MKKQSLSFVICLAFAARALPMELDHDALDSIQKTDQTLTQLYTEIVRNGCKNPHCLRYTGKCHYHEDQARGYLKEKEKRKQQLPDENQVQNFLEDLNGFFPLLQPLPKDAPWKNGRMHAHVHFDQLTQFLNLGIWHARGGKLNKAMNPPFTGYKFKNARGLRAFFKISSINASSTDTFETQLRQWIETYKKNYRHFLSQTGGNTNER